MKRALAHEFVVKNMRKFLLENVRRAAITRTAINHVSVCGEHTMSTSSIVGPPPARSLHRRHTHPSFQYSHEIHDAERCR